MPSQPKGTPGPAEAGLPHCLTQKLQGGVMMELQVNNGSSVFLSVSTFFLHLDIFTIDFNEGRSYRLIGSVFKDRDLIMCGSGIPCLKQIICSEK